MKIKWITSSEKLKLFTSNIFSLDDRKPLLISFLLAFCFGQSDFQKGVTHYKKRHEGCIEDRAKPMQIEMAITYFENVLSNKTNKKEAALYLLKSYYFKGKFAEEDRALKKKILKK